MELHETKVFSFVCPYLDGSIKSFQVAGDTQQEAAAKFKEWLAKAQLELSMLFPQVAPETPQQPTPSEFNKMQISLLEDLAKACGWSDDMHLPTFVLDTTGLEMTVNNFKAIVPIFEALRDGNTPTNGKKKA